MRPLRGPQNGERPPDDDDLGREWARLHPLDPLTAPQRRHATVDAVRAVAEPCADPYDTFALVLAAKADLALIEYGPLGRKRKPDGEGACPDCGNRLVPVPGKHPVCTHPHHPAGAPPKSPDRLPTHVDEP